MSSILLIFQFYPNTIQCYINFSVYLILVQIMFLRFIPGAGDIA